MRRRAASARPISDRASASGLAGAVLLGCSLTRTRGAEVNYETPQPSQLYQRCTRSDAQRV